MPAPSIEQLLAIIKKNYVNADLDLVRLAFEYAEQAHHGQVRKSGEPYILHPLTTAITLAEMRLALPIIIAGLLHDVPEDTVVGIKDIEKNFGAEIAGIVAGITKLGKVKYRGMERYVENLRKMFVAMAADVRVVFVKFADRLHNLATLDALPPVKRKRIALETLEIYAPIANRLGMGEMQSRLEDAAFPHAYPKEYAVVSKIAASRLTAAHLTHEKILARIREILRHSALKNFEVRGRVKHLYSLFRKLAKNEMNIEKIFDLFAARILVETVADCYAALGLLHSVYTPLKGRIKDYISVPKPNGYRSLHTTVFSEDGSIVEFQIRTFAMHEECEVGVAAHWHYDEQGKKSARADDKLRWVRELAAIQEQLKSSDLKSNIESLKIDVFQHHIFVFTPQGDVIDLPEHSTPVDFAYAIHSDIGNHCIASKINNEMAALDDELKNGDMVTIVTDKRRRGPSMDWLKFVKTHGARSKIRGAMKIKNENWIAATDEKMKRGGKR